MAFLLRLFALVHWLSVCSGGACIIVHVFTVNRSLRPLRCKLNVLPVKLLENLRADVLFWVICACWLCLLLRVRYSAATDYGFSSSYTSDHVIIYSTYELGWLVVNVADVILWLTLCLDQFPCSSISCAGVRALFRILVPFSSWHRSHIFLFHDCLGALWYVTAGIHQQLPRPTYSLTIFYKYLLKYIWETLSIFCYTLVHKCNRF